MRIPSARIQVCFSFILVATAFGGASTANGQSLLPHTGGYSVAPMADINNDGVPDYASGEWNTGKLRSGANGAVLRSFPTFIPAPFLCGTEVSCAGVGDIDLDGYQDAVFQMPGDCCKFFDPGWAFAFSTRTGAKLWQATGTGCTSSATGRVNLVAIGDLNQDGVSEFATGVGGPIQIRNGRTGAPIHYIAVSSQELATFAAIGDVTGDSVPDLLVGTQTWSPGGGIVRVYSGATWLPVLTFHNNGTPDGFARSVASGGDMDLDGVPDFLVGATLSNLGGDFSGSVFAFSPVVGMLPRRVDGWWPGDRLGMDCATPGDIDQDGLPEIAASPTTPGTTISQGYVLLQSSLEGNSVHLIRRGNVLGIIGRRLIPMGDINLDGQRELGVSFENQIDFINFASGVSTYGTGTIGCKGGHVLDVNKTPSIGTLDFELRVNHVPNVGLGGLIVSDLANVAGADLLGISVNLHVGIEGATSFDIFDFTTATGAGVTASIPIPPDAGLVGARFYLQAMFYWQDGNPCAPSPLGLSSSAGLALIVQN